MRESKEQQLFFMRWAIQLSQKGRCTAPPNPWVGCVIVKEGEIVGEGFHEAAGKKHAEIVALESAGSRAHGSTLYVTLEPCAHYGRTPPCTDALVRAGIKKVIIPFLDPDPQVSGKGVETLKKAGIEVEIGVGKEDAEYSLAPYLFQRKNARPFCLLKAAISLDGKIAARDSSSQWITGEEARKDAHLLRAESQALLVGSGTALRDNPQLTVRHISYTGKPPLRVLLDTKGRVPVEGSLADTTLAPTLIYTSHQGQAENWKKRGAEVVLVESINLKRVVEDLGRKQIIQLLVEGGGLIHSAFINAQLANRFILYMGNCLLGEEGKSFIPDLTVSTISQAPRWQLENICRLNNDVRLDYKVI